MSDLRDVDNDGLQTQLAVWEESRASDEEELEAVGGVDLNNHEDAFTLLMSKVCVCVCVCVCTRMRMHACLCAYICVHVYVGQCMWVCAGVSSYSLFQVLTVV